jgi:hypothetical protein
MAGVGLAWGLFLSGLLGSQFRFLVEIFRAPQREYIKEHSNRAFWIAIVSTVSTWEEHEIPSLEPPVSTSAVQSCIHCLGVLLLLHSPETGLSS